MLVIEVRNEEFFQVGDIKMFVKRATNKKTKVYIDAPKELRICRRLPDPLEASKKDSGGRTEASPKGLPGDLPRDLQD